MRRVGHVARMGDRRGAYRGLVNRTDGKRPLVRLGHIWKDNIKMALQDVEWESRDCTILAQDRNRWRAFVNAVMNLQVL